MAQADGDRVENCVQQSQRSILGKIFPNGICLQNIGWRIGLKFFRGFGAPVKIEFAVDDLEDFRVYTSSLAGRRKTPRSVPALLRSKVSPRACCVY